MKILLSAFDCNPLFGSDPYVGWSWVSKMAKVNEVYALIRSDHQPYIEKYCYENTVENIDKIHFIYINSSKFFGKIVYKFNRNIAVVGQYCIWQRKAYRAAKKLYRKEGFDITHIVSLADFRFPGYFWKIPVPFIFGSVGGAQETPDCLADYIKGYERNERFRTLANKILIMLPNYKKAINKAALVYCSNDETLCTISNIVLTKNRKKIFYMTELGIEKKYLLSRKNLHHKDSRERVHILVAGRLMYRKGILLLLDAIKCIDTNKEYVVDIYGDGEQKQKIIDTIEKFGLENNVILHGHVTFAEMQNVYKTADIYCLPSLRETTGTAVFEAMANKLPVLSLNQNGVKYIVGEDAGILVDLYSKEQVVSDLAKALKFLIENPKRRIDMGEKAFKKIHENYVWEKKIEEMSEVYSQLIKKSEFNI